MRALLARVTDRGGLYSAILGDDGIGIENAGREYRTSRQQFHRPAMALFDFLLIPSWARKVVIPVAINTGAAV
jgi:hypothetical protein